MRIARVAAVLGWLAVAACESLLDVDFDRAHVADQESDASTSDQAVHDVVVEPMAEAGNDGSDASIDHPSEASTCGDGPATCYDGPAGTANIGACHTGNLVCDGGAPICSGQVTPKFEDPATLADDSCDGLTGNYDFSQKFGNSNTQTARGVGVDAQGNSYLTGTLYGSITFGLTTLNAIGSKPDIFIAKLDANGQPKWAKSFGSSELESAAALVVDSAGTLYVVGEIQGPTDFGDGVHTPANGKYDVFVAKFDTNGTIVWSRSFGNPAESDYAHDVAVDSQGNIAVVGRFHEQIQFGATPLSNVPGDPNDGFVVKLDAQGNVLWANGIIGSGVQLALGVAFAPTGRVVVSGSSDGIASAATGSVGTAGQKSAFVAAFEAGGGFAWNEQLGLLASSSEFEVGKPSVASTGAIAVATTYVGSTTIAGQTHNSVGGSEDGLVVGLDAQGAPIWSRSFGTASDEDNFNLTAIDSAGNVVVLGDVESAFDCGGGPLAYAGDDDVVILKLHGNDGQSLWCRTFGNASYDHIDGLALDGLDRIWIAGQFAGVLNLGATPHVSSGIDVLLARFLP